MNATPSSLHFAPYEMEWPHHAGMQEVLIFKKNTGFFLAILIFIPSTACYVQMLTTFPS